MMKMKVLIFKRQEHLTFVEIPEPFAYQLSALNLRLQKEIHKLTGNQIPDLDQVVAECDHLELIAPDFSVISSLDYVNELERQFAQIQGTHYPVISLLTEIRALQAQLEQWHEEEMGGPSASLSS